MGVLGVGAIPALLWSECPADDGEATCWNDFGMGRSDAFLTGAKMEFSLGIPAGLLGGLTTREERRAPASLRVHGLPRRPHRF